MSDTMFARKLLRAGVRMFAVVAVASIVASSTPALAVVAIFDGFGDADRNNDGAITFYDTDINDSGTWNDPVDDLGLSDRGIVEVTAAQDPGDTGIVWLGTRSFDTAANIPKSRLRIINDSVATGGESAAEIHGDGLALGVESRGGGSSFIGRFGQSITVGPEAGDKVVASVDFRAWREADIAFTPPDFNELRWGLYQDSDNEFGTTATFGSGTFSAPPGEIVEWGKDDGNWFASQPGAEGDKGVRAQLTFGSLAASVDARVNWEYNLAGINGTSNNGRLLEGTGVSDTPGSGGDTGTIASPLNEGDGPGGFIQGSTYSSHKLSIEVVRLADGLIEVASFVDNVEILRDEIKTTDTGYSVLSPPPFSYDYVAFRNSADFDYVIDNFMLEVFGSNAVEPGLDGDFNNDGIVDAVDYTVWRNNFGDLDETNINNNGDGGGVGPGDYTLWKSSYGNMAPGGGGLGSFAVPEPVSAAMLLPLIVAGLMRAARVRR